MAGFPNVVLVLCSILIIASSDSSTILKSTLGVSMSTFTSQGDTSIEYSDISFGSTSSGRYSTPRKQDVTATTLSSNPTQRGEKKESRTGKIGLDDASLQGGIPILPAAISMASSEEGGSERRLKLPQTGGSTTGTTQRHSLSSSPGRPKLGQKTDDADTTSLLDVLMVNNGSRLQHWPVYQGLRQILVQEMDAVPVPPNISLGSLEANLAFLRLDYLQMAKRALALLPPRRLLARPDDVSETCYEELMTFFDALIGSPERSSHGQTDYRSMDWAVRVFDAYGKPGPGILSGALQFTGYYDQCLDTRAAVPAGTRLANNVVNETKDFGMRYCRVQANVGRSLNLTFSSNMNKFWTRGVNFPLLLNWGVCVPKSCHGGDITALLTKGTMEYLDLPVEGAVCFDGPDFEDDPGAIVTVTVLGIFACTIIFCTALDIFLRFGRTRVPESSGGSSVGEEPALGARGGPSVNYTLTISEDPPEKESHAVSEKGEGRTPNANGHLEMKKIHLHSNGYKKTTDNNHVSREENSKISEAKGRKETVEVAIKGRGGNNKGKRPVGTGHQIVKIFSFYTNFAKLVRTKSSEGVYQCVQGIRVITMTWIVLGHTHTFGAILDETNQMFDNLTELPHLVATKAFHIVGSANLGVDTFFVLSGFLVMVTTLKELKNSNWGPMFWIQFIFHRFWRLTPVYMMVLMTGTNLYDHIVHGPLKADKFEEFYQCKTKWWSHLLYVNNFYEPEKKCMTWTWYLAVDMQLFLISPIFIYPVYRNKKYGVSFILVALLLSIVGAFVSEFENGGQFVMMDISFVNYWSHVYTMPWARSGAFCVGLLLGVVMDSGDRKPIMSKTKAFLVWVLAVAVALFLLFINHNQWRERGDHWSRGVQSTYEALVRPVWATCVAWVIYACCNGLGGFANSVLSWKGFLPASRLTYCTYLLHPIIITFVLYSRRTTIYMDPQHLSIIYNFLGNLVLTYLLATVYSLTFETPMMTLEKLLLRRRR
ncbi:uncharacterized protein LOC101860204 [Aplysia californica]|uniref:Uncharacterized protein LOC101860204 n=1 Tax=Aplysia californica TaxID=6500 RepID=A0ABM1AB20_APLCA|nr:uncharacterized protein LOC101860204 [Aplysia californica]